MEPYDADKVDLANELYAILTKKDLTYSENLYVEQKAKKKFINNVCIWYSI